MSRSGSKRCSAAIFRWAALALLTVSTAQAQLGHSASDNITSLAGTWSSGSGGVQTGINFANPVNFTFNVPATTGISFSFTDDGYFEEAHYQFNANGSEPHCIKAYLIYQHGSYTLQPNGSITLDPIKADGRIEVQDPCAYTTTVMTYYYEPAVYAKWMITNDLNHQQYMLQLWEANGDAVGAPIPRMYLSARPPNMLPTTQLTTNETLKANAAANGGSINAAQRTSVSGFVLATMTGLVLAAAGLNFR